MLDYKLDILRDGRAHKFCISQDAEPLPYSSAIDLWQHSEAFRSFFISLLAQAPFTAFRWETPPINTATLNRAFEFVLLDSPGLARTADPVPFARHFATTDVSWLQRVYSNSKKHGHSCPVERGEAPAGTQNRHTRTESPPPR